MSTLPSTLAPATDLASANRATVVAKLSPVSPHHVQKIAELAEAAGEVEYAQRLAAAQTALADPILQVAVFGEFNRGKSTLINALLGRMVLPAKLIPTTGHVTTLVYGTDEEVRLQLKDGALVRHPLDQLDAVASLRADGSTRGDIRTIEVAVNHPLLTTIHFWDTPGINEAVSRNQHTRAAIEAVDAVLVVFDARQLLSQTERTLVVDWLQQEWGKPIIPVINFMNQVSDEDATWLRQRFDHWYSRHLLCRLDRPWFEVNALAALKYQLGKSSAPVDHFFDLQRALLTMSEATRTAFQLQSRTHRIHKTVNELAQHNTATLTALHIDAAAVVAQRDRQQQEIAERQRHLVAAAGLITRKSLVQAEQTLTARLAALLKYIDEAATPPVEKAEQADWQSTLAGRINTAYQSHLTKCVRSLEKSGLIKMNKLGSEVGLSPSPWTLGEHVTLQARITTAVVKPDYDEDSSAGWGGVGFIIGSLLFPVPMVGGVVGAAIGGLVSAWWTRKAPNYAAAYRGQAELAWQTDSARIQRALQAELTRVGEEMAAQLNSQANALASASGKDEAHELTARTQLAQEIVKLDSLRE